MKLPLIFILLLILILATITFAIWPNVLKIEKLSRNIYEQRVRLEKLYNQGQLLKKARQELKETESQIEILNNLFVPEGEELKFITALEKLASKNKIEQEIELNPSQQTQFKANYKTVPVQLNLKGDFGNLLKYLTEIERINYYLNINSLSLQTSSISHIPERMLSSSPKKQIQAFISGESYWQMIEKSH